MRRLARKGDVARFGRGPLQLWLLNRPDLAAYMLETNEHGFDKGRGISTRFLGESMLTLEGEEHDRRRGSIDPAFTTDAVAPYAGRIVGLTEGTARGWTNGAEVDAQAEMGRQNVAVAVSAFFGLDPASERGRELTQALESASEAVAKPLARRSFTRARARLDELILGLVREARADDGEGSVLAALTRIEGLPDQAIRDELVTMYSGHNSVGLGLGWSLYLLATNPQAAERVHEELSGLDGAPGADDLDRLEFTRACVSEALRVLPPIWILVRRATRDHELEGFTIPKGAMAVTSQYLIQHDPRFWEDADAYRPERWLEQAADRAPFSYFPFGGGSRDCLGEAFARMEMTLTLATLLRGRRIALAPGVEVRLRARVKLMAADGIPLRIAAAA